MAAKSVLRQFHEQIFLSTFTFKHSLGIKPMSLPLLHQFYVFLLFAVTISLTLCKISLPVCYLYLWKSTLVSWHESRERTLRDRISHTMCCTWPLTHSLIYTVDRSEYMALALRYISLQRRDSTEEWERRCNRAAVPSLNGPQPRSEEAQLTACNRPAIHLQQHWQAIWTTHTPCCLSSSAINDVFLVWSVFSVNMRLLLVALQWWSREDRKPCLKEGGSTISCKVKWGLSSIILIQQHCQVSPFTSYPNNHSSLHESCDKYYYFLFVPEISSEEKECFGPSWYMTDIAACPPHTDQEWYKDE